MTTIRATSLIAVLLVAASQASAGDIVRWVDVEGNVHFGNPQFGPSGAESVEVSPANGMEVPRATSSGSTGGSPVMVMLDKKPNRQVIGFRGHQWTVSRNPRHGRRH